MAEHDGERLGKGNLSLPDVVAQSVGYMGPVFSGTFFIPTIVGLSIRQARARASPRPFAILLTAIGMLALAWIISRYAKRIHAAGALYDYVGEGFGRPAGLFAGWVYYGGALMLTLAIGLAFGGFVSLHARHASTASTSTGSGSRSRSGSWPGRSRCSACRSRRAPSSCSRSSPSP